MKSTTTTLALLFALLFHAGAAHAQNTYRDALLLVREGKYEQAYSIFWTLAEENHAASQFSVALMYQLGRGIKKNPVMAWDYYIKAAKQDYAPAINNLGMMYLNGEYVEQNHYIAFKLFEKAASEHAQAKDNLARMYFEGWGVEQDIDKAIQLYDESGQDGYFLAHVHLAEHYERGITVPKDMDEAIKWYRAAAANNNGRAIDWLRSRSIPIEP